MGLFQSPMYPAWKVGTELKYDLPTTGFDGVLEAWDCNDTAIREKCVIHNPVKKKVSLILLVLFN